jgi:ADP-L-glycero-D-manno-heptose 6-epimerase
MIIITGAAGFIGSCLVSKLNLEGFVDLILVDDFTKTYKEKNLINAKYTEKVERMQFFDWAKGKENQIQFIFHIGARTDTTEFDTLIFDELNLHYSQALWNYCVEDGIPLVYASSAATYGMGEFGFDDEIENDEVLKPLNPYGLSKLQFDCWAKAQERKPFFWAGFKFFNVYGPNEYHKGRMASVVFHAFNQIKANNELKLFKSHHPDYKDGEQKRDFVYVKDVVNVLFNAMIMRSESGIYNLGSGNARTFNEMAAAIFSALQIPTKISYFDTPIDIRNTYQYFTEANMDKLKKAGYYNGFMTIEEGVKDYIQQYLQTNQYL